MAADVYSVPRDSTNSGTDDTDFLAAGWTIDTGFDNIYAQYDYGSYSPFSFPFQISSNDPQETTLAGIKRTVTGRANMYAFSPAWQTFIEEDGTYGSEPFELEKKAEWFLIDSSSNSLGMHVMDTIFYDSGVSPFVHYERYLYVSVNGSESTHYQEFSFDGPIVGFGSYVPVEPGSTNDHVMNWGEPGVLKYGTRGSTALPYTYVTSTSHAFTDFSDFTTLKIRRTFTPNGFENAGPMGLYSNYLYYPDEIATEQQINWNVEVNETDTGGWDYYTPTLTGVSGTTGTRFATPRTR